MSRTLLLVLLLSVAGIGNTFAIDFYVVFDGSAWGFNYTDTGNHYVEVANGPNKSIVTIPSTITYNSVEYTVTGIGASAFSSKTNLTSVTIPNTVTYIGNSAFYRCTNLETVTFLGSGSLTTIGNNAFQVCSKLSSIVIPSTVTTIGSYAFGSCSLLTTINLPNSVTSIGQYAFFSCATLSSITIPNQVTAIEAYTFDFCSDLATVIVPNSVTSIGEYAFYSCSSLTSIDLPNALTTIGNEAFESCGLTSITIPASVTIIGDYAFSICSDLATIEVETGNTVYDSRNNCNAIIETTTNTLLFGCQNTVIPSTVTAIGTHAFYYNSGLSSIVIPNSVETIGDNAFGNCTNLTAVTLGNAVESIGEQAFYCCPLESITVAGGNTTYDSRGNCNAIIETSTNTLVQGCVNTVIPNTVVTIGDNAFGKLTSLTSITIPSSVTSIGNAAFFDCTNLAFVDMPNSVTTIGDNAFGYCSHLTSFVFPNALTTIGAGAFKGCSRLASVVIPNSVTTIGNNAFFSSGLTSVTIGSSVESIDYNTFFYCSNLETVNMLPTAVPSLGTYVFSSTSSNLVIYVPYESLSAYQSATNWSSHASKMQPMAYKSIAGYGTGNGNWAFIASPLTTTDLAPTVVDNMIPTNGNYDLYSFDQSEANEWRNYKANTFNLINGQGYLYANAEDANLIFKGEFNEDATKEVGLTYDEGKEFAGWNLVGNPFPVQAYANRSYYAMNSAGTAIEPTAVSSATAIPVCTGVMVKAESTETNPQVTFSTTAPNNQPNQGLIQIAVAQCNTRGASVQDKAIVSFNAGDQLGKFVFNEDNSRLYIPHNHHDYAVVYAEKQGEVPVNFKAADHGSYTISVSTENTEMRYLHLIDNFTGADVDLLALRQAQEPAEYTFEAKTTDYASRFRLVFSTDDENGASTGSATFAFIDASGNIIIITDGSGTYTLQVIDVMGRVLVSRDGVHSVSTNGMTPGVYVLRLINGDNVKAQKIVIDR